MWVLIVVLWSAVLFSAITKVYPFRSERERLFCRLRLHSSLRPFLRVCPGRARGIIVSIGEKMLFGSAVFEVVWSYTPN